MKDWEFSSRKDSNNYDDRGTARGISRSDAVKAANELTRRTGEKVYVQPKGTRVNR